MSGTRKTSGTKSNTELLAMFYLDFPKGCSEEKNSSGTSIRSDRAKSNICVQNKYIEFMGTREKKIRKKVLGLEM